jgi:hypothetical protein
VPSIEENFDKTAPGLGDNPTFARWGTFIYFDHRDAQSGPRSGGVYGVRFRQYADLDFDRYSFRQVEFEAQHYLPYFNKTRVLALRATTVLSFPTEGQVVPFYLQPTIGGNDNLRGFPRPDTTITPSSSASSTAGAGSPGHGTPFSSTRQEVIDRKAGGFTPK